MNIADIEKGAGEWAILDLPVPLEPVIVDRTRPLEDQLPPGRYLEEAKKMLEHARILSIFKAVKKAKRVYIVGNGGSYANAVHICNDLIGCGIRAYTLDPATLTAIANDFGYEEIFARWITTVGEEGDLLLALSGSGKSPNIVQAMVAAKSLGMEAILVTDYLKTMDMQKSEETQIEMGHELMRRLRAVGG